MATYAIGDVQGCFTALQKLLHTIAFDPHHDTLWLTGDLVNRGPHSLEVLRFIKSLEKQQVTVLGNHDLHLLAIVYNERTARPNDTLDAILTAPDKIELIEWLRHRPLLHHNNYYVMTHAGIAPPWTLTQAITLAGEVENILQGSHPEHFLTHLYGNKPDAWQPQWSGSERWRCITNYLTRMRYCNAQGHLQFPAEPIPDIHIPWFHVPRRNPIPLKIIFGHWSALHGYVDVPNIYALDTGCVWGGQLTAFCLETEKRSHVSCAEYGNCKSS